MRVIFMGTPDFAAAILDAVYEAGHELLCCVSQPDKPVGRHAQIRPTAVKARAMQLGIPVLQPLKASDPDFVGKIRELAPDVIVVAAYGRILKKALLDIPRLGCVNVHASLLPRWRGAAPIQWAVIEGDKVTGVTAMLMDEGLDTGAMLLRREVEIRADETGGTLFDRLAEAGGELIKETLARMEDSSEISTVGSTGGKSAEGCTGCKSADEESVGSCTGGRTGEGSAGGCTVEDSSEGCYGDDSTDISAGEKGVDSCNSGKSAESCDGGDNADGCTGCNSDDGSGRFPGRIGSLVPVPQPSEGVTYAPMLRKDTGRIDWSQDAERIERLVRGLDPWPGTFTYSGKRMLKIEKVRLPDDEELNKLPGADAKGTGVLLTTAQGGDEPEQEGDKPVRGSDVPQQESEKPIQRNDVPVRGSDKPEQISDNPVRRDGVLVSRGDEPEQRNGKPEQVSDMPVRRGDESACAAGGMTSTYGQISPGESLVRDGRIYIRCGKGWLEILKVRPEGKKSMKAADYLRGNSIGRLSAVREQ